VFQVGDKITYTGAFRNASADILKDKSYNGDPTEWVVKNVHGDQPNNLVYAYNPTGRAYKNKSDPRAFYVGDFELTRTEPEVYEEWFK